MFSWVDLCPFPGPAVQNLESKMIVMMLHLCQMLQVNQEGLTRLGIKSGVDGVTGWNLPCILDLGVSGAGKRFLGVSAGASSEVLPVFLKINGYFEFFFQNSFYIFYI